jgi:mono/diheme cytochrome c family protein
MRLALLVLLGGCDWSLHRMQEPVGCTVDGTTALLPHGSCNLQPPPNIVPMMTAEPAPAVTRALLERGRNRFERVCAACHGVTGDGVSAVARSMTLRKPPSLVDQTAMALSDERIFTVLETGYGLMPSYRWVTTADRYAILHYVRALQQRVVPLDELPPAQRAEAQQWLR